MNPPLYRLPSPAQGRVHSLSQKPGVVAQFGHVGPNLLFRRVASVIFLRSWNESCVVRWKMEIWLNEVRCKSRYDVIFVVRNGAKLRILRTLNWLWSILWSVLEIWNPFSWHYLDDIACNGLIFTGNELLSSEHYEVGKYAAKKMEAENRNTVHSWEMCCEKESCPKPREHAEIGYDAVQVIEANMLWNMGPTLKLVMNRQRFRKIITSQKK